MSLKPFCDHLFLFLWFLHEIHTEHILIVLLYIFEMLHKCRVGEFKRSRDLSLSCDTSLSPEDRHRSSDLQVRAAILIEEKHLLQFAIVSYISIIINTSCIISCACLFTRTTSHQVEIKFLALNVHLEIADISLNEWNSPHRTDLRSNNVFAHIAIPAESPVTFSLESLLLLWETQIISVWKVVSFREELSNVFNEYFKLITSFTCKQLVFISLKWHETKRTNCEDIVFLQCACMCSVFSED